MEEMINILAYNNFGFDQKKLVNNRMPNNWYFIVMNKYLIKRIIFETKL